MAAETSNQSLTKEDEEKIKAASLLLESFLADSTIDGQIHGKQDLEDVISKKLEEDRSSLDQVKNHIETVNGKPLSSIDHAFIDSKYLKICSELWLQEVNKFLKKVSEQNNSSVIKIIFRQLDSIKDFSQIPYPFDQLNVYKLLLYHRAFLSKEDERLLIHQFKKQCLEKIVATSDSIKKEITFLEKFLDFLDTVSNHKIIIAELQVQKFHRGEISFGNVLDNIMRLEVNTYGGTLSALQRETKYLNVTNGNYLTDKFKEITGEYIEPVKLHYKKIDGRWVIEVTGRRIVVSEILQQLEIKLSGNSSTEEVRFVGGNMIHIDADLRNEVWHGKNVVVFTQKVKVHCKVTWDVSGKDSTETYSSNAGTGEDGDGRRGQDGFPGESGGNVLVVSEEIENPEYLTIVSNGGKGSDGQDGGNGADGIDGKCYTQRELRNILPLNIKTLEFSHSIAKIRNVILPVLLRDSVTEHTTETNCFIQGKTNENYEVTVTYQAGGYARLPHGLVLVKGSPGLPGGCGGEFGLGGMGGFNGEITVNNARTGIVINANSGENGKNGNGGLPGSFGKNGWDIGYTDYKFWKGTNFVGSDLSSKLQLIYSDNVKKGSSIWCGYKNKNVAIESAGSVATITNKFERTITRQGTERQHLVQATRKKTISRICMSTTYSQQISSSKKSPLQNMASDLENTRQGALQAMGDNKQTEPVMQLEVKRHATFSHGNKVKHSQDTGFAMSTGHPTKTTGQDVDDLLRNLKREPKTIQSWILLRSVELNRTQLVELFHICEEFKTSFAVNQVSQKNGDYEKLKGVEQLLIEKNRIITLQELANQLPPQQLVESNSELSPESVIRYLIEDKDCEIIISHPKLGTLDQYLHGNSEEQQNIFYTFCKGEFVNCDEYYEILRRALKTFVLKVGTQVHASPDVKKYYDEYNKFLETQGFQELLNQPRHSAEPELRLKSNANDSSGNEQDEELQQNKGRHTLSKRLKNQHKGDYDWEKCFKDQSVLKEFLEYNVYKKSKERYEELLAFVFDVNIRLYKADDASKLFLRDNHNPSSKRVIHLLCRDEKFQRLRIDEEHLKLEREFSYRDILYKQILTEVEILGHNQEFGNYLNEEKDLNNIAEYFPSDIERKQIKERLEKITSQFTGHHGILYTLSKRFSSEGRHISFQALCCLVNSILAFIVDDKEELSIFCWIVAAYPQQNWTDELLLLQLEIYYKKTLPEKSKWRMYLSKIENKDILLMFMAKLNQYKSSSSITFECVETTLYLLSNIPNEVVSLEKLGLPEWSYALKEPYWRCKLSQLTTWQENDENLSTSVYYLLDLENRSGINLVEAFMNNLKGKTDELSPELITEILCYFHNDKWMLNEDDLKILSWCRISEWKKKMLQKFATDDKDRDATTLVELMANNTNNAEKILSKLFTLTDFVSNFSQGTSVRSLTEHDIKHWVQVVKGDGIERKGKVKPAYEEMLAVIDRAIRLKRGFNLRDTQKLSILTLFTNERNILAQVSTGEGKSLIVVAMSIMKALCGEKVDVITSSSVLAKRDAEDNKDIYTLFDINVSHNASENIEKRKQAYSNNQVVYGDLSSFQRDYLLDRFYKRNILGDRSFQNVMVDEVDSMLLDKGNNMLYLSHDLAGIDKVESVYLYIWQWINRPAQSYEEIEYALNKGAIKEAVLKELYYMINKDDIRHLGCELSEQQVNDIWERLIQAEIINHQGRMKESVSDAELRKVLQDNVTKLKTVLSPELSNYEDRLAYLLKECICTKKHIYVPNYLKPFVEQHLDAWIDSAITALFMQERDDYIVDVDRTGTSPDLNPNITIIDRDTGTDQANSQWGDGLHQFIQLKHGCNLSLQSLKAVFISNVSYLKLYSKLYGLTGTLGSQRDRDLLKQVHDVDFVVVPTTKPKHFLENLPIICAGQEEWINTIHNEAKKLTEEKKRSVLIICDTVDDVETLHKYFASKEAKNVVTYTRDYEDLDIAQSNKRLGPGQIIIATNLAGRGTDIKLTEELKEAGGLHVCITYLPNNSRIEEQAFGRVARKGEKGSGQLIIKDLEGLDTGNKTILDLKKERDAKELLRIIEVVDFYETHIKTEESYFIRFKEQYEQMHPKVIEGLKDEKELNEILLLSCLDKWAFWLDENSANIKGAAQTTSNTVEKAFQVFLLKLKSYKSNNIDDLLSWVENSPVQMVKFGKYLSKNKKHVQAIKLYDEVIKREPYFSEAAHYYKSYEIGKQINWERPEDKQSLEKLKSSLRKAKRLFEDQKTFSMYAAAVIGNLKKHNSQSIVQIDGYEEQQKSLCSLYDMFIKSIDDILGHSVTPQSLESYDINETLAEVLFEDLLKEGVLKKHRVKNNISEEALRKISPVYGLSDRDLQTFLSKLKGLEINIKNFPKTLSSLQLPSKEEFWELLIKGHVLNHEVRYIAINKEKIRAIDPSLLSFITEKVTKGELKEESLEGSKLNQIFLNPEQIELQTETSIVLREDAFREFISNKKYKFLKQDGVFSFNKKAFLNVDNIKAMTFPFHDSITLQDFTKVNITKKEAKGVLAALVEKKILEQKNPESSAYRLIIQSDEIEQLQLSVPLYESAVKILLGQCFAYRIALQDVEAQLKEANDCISIRLITKPHHNLLYDLLEQSIISPVTVTTEAVDIEEKLKGMYSQTMTEDIFKQFLLHTIPTDQIDDLFKQLIQKEWIEKRTFSNLLQELPEVFNENTSELLKRTEFIVSSPFYSIRDSEKRKNGLDSAYKNIEKMVKGVLDNRLHLSKSCVITNISGDLKKCRSLLETFRITKFDLRASTEFFDKGQFRNIKEMYTFSLNGFDHVIQIGETKYTVSMIVSALAVAWIGIAQIAINAYIVLTSAQIMTGVSTGLINEGLNDISFAGRALTRGTFSWKEYRSQKLQSLVKTAALCFFNASLKPKALNKFQKAVEDRPNLKDLTEKWGITFWKAAEVKSPTSTDKQKIWNDMRKNIAERAKSIVGQTVRDCIANDTYDTTVRKFLTSTSDSIASAVWSDIENNVNKHDISKSLEESYQTLGERRAIKMVETLSEKVINKQFDDTNLKSIFKTVSWVNDVVAYIPETMKKSHNYLEFAVQSLDTLNNKWVERSFRIAKTLKIPNNFFDELDKEMNNLLQKFGTNLPTGQIQGRDKDCERFKSKVIGQWKELLHTRFDQVLSQNVFQPILKVSLLPKAGTKSQKYQGKCKSAELNRCLEMFLKPKQDYRDALKEGVKKQPNVDKLSATDCHISKQYKTYVAENLIKTRNPKLLKAAAQENIPLRFDWAPVFVVVMEKILGMVSIGNTNFTVILNRKNGTRHSFPSRTKGVNGLIVELQLKDEQFTLCGTSKSRNNSFYDAFSKHVPELKEMTQDEFKTNVAYAIDHDVELKHLIQQTGLNIPSKHLSRTRDDNLVINKSIPDKETVKQIVRDVHEAVRKVNEQQTKDHVQASNTTQVTLTVLAVCKCEEHGNESLTEKLPNRSSSPTLHTEKSRTQSRKN